MSGVIFSSDGNRSTDDVSPRKKSREKIVYPFTDDTAMARSVAASLIANNDLNSKDMAKRYFCLIDL